MATKAVHEKAMRFRCGDDWLYGILSVPQSTCSRGVLIAVGGPQYRIGSHRQFTLLARALAQHGIAAMRFDYRGMGDSQGTMRDFETVGDDLRTAIDAFTAAMPGLQDIVLWGLCDAASAIAMYAASDARVNGIVMLNPWVRTDNGLARATLKHYYRGRLMDSAFWIKLFQGRFDLVNSLKSILSMVRATRVPSEQGRETGPLLPDRMQTGLHAFRGRIMVITGSADLTGREFCDLGAGTLAWRRLFNSPRMTRHEIDKADHTFSRRVWRDEVAALTCDWVCST